MVMALNASKVIRVESNNLESKLHANISKDESLNADLINSAVTSEFKDSFTGLIQTNELKSSTRP